MRKERKEKAVQLPQTKDLEPRRAVSPLLYKRSRCSGLRDWTLLLLLPGWDEWQMDDHQTESADQLTGLN